MNLSKATLLAILGMAAVSCNFGEKRPSGKEINKMVISKGERMETKEKKKNPKTLVITTEDYMFKNVPDTLSSGYINIKIDNKGTFPHNAGLLKLSGNHDYADFQEYMKNKKEEEHFPEWAKYVGGPTAPLGGGTTETMVKLETGNYVLVCGVPVPKAIPHYMKGMTKGLTVVENSSEAEAPHTNVKMVMDDYSFELSKEITPGKYTMEVVNTASQPHEFLLVKLEDGKSGRDMLNWLGQVVNAEKGPLPDAPGEFLNGVSPMEKGVSNFITVDFEPGEYCLLCPYPDEGDGKPHFMHGMVKQFTVKRDKTES